MSRDNQIWEAPRLHGELLKLGIRISRRPLPNTWSAIPSRHPKRGERSSPIMCPNSFRSTSSRYTPSGSRFCSSSSCSHIIVDVSSTLMSRLTRRQSGPRSKIVEAFPFDSSPKYLLRDRDRIYGLEFRKQIDAMGIKEVLSAPRSPWQRAHVERVIGSIRRECLDHVIVFDEKSLRRNAAFVFQLLLSI